MAMWRFNLNFREFLGEGESKEDMLKAAAGIRLEIGRKLPERLVKEAGSILSKMDEAAKVGELDWFNASLDRLWSYFDQERVWVEL
jgi:hypothetical protein